MTVASPKNIDPAPEGAELVPVYFDTERIVTPADNPAYTPAMLADLADSVRQHGQLVPGWMCPSPDLPEDQRLCLEGNRRLAVARLLGLRFWAFDLRRFVPEEERIRLLFAHNGIRRVRCPARRSPSGPHAISRSPAARTPRRPSYSAARPGQRSAGPSASVASRRNSRRRADLLGLRIRSLVAAAPAALMSQVVDFALTPKADGKSRHATRCRLFIQQLEEGRQAQGPQAQGDHPPHQRPGGDAGRKGAGFGRLGGRGPEGPRRQARQACRRAARRLAVPVPVRRFGHRDQRAGRCVAARDLHAERESNEFL